MKRILLFLIASITYAQAPGSNLVIVNINPSGPCVIAQFRPDTFTLQYNPFTNTLWGCTGNPTLWTPVGGVSQGGLTTISGDAHFLIDNPATTPALTFIPQSGDYNFSMITGLITTPQLPVNSAIFLTGAVTPPVLSCTAGQHLYLYTGSPQEIWVCPVTNIWIKVLTTPNTGVLAMTAQFGADACSTVPAGSDCIGINASQQPTLKLPDNTVLVIGEILGAAHTPTTSSETCTVGWSHWDAGFLYVCTTTNTWKRAALSAF